MPTSDLKHVLEQYPLVAPDVRIEPLGTAGGFSGARFWRVTTAEHALCVRRWSPEHPDRQRLQMIHDVLRHVHIQGVTIVPVPWETHGGGSFVEMSGYRWEIANWMPGSADYQRNPSPAKLVAALKALARFHVAAATHPAAESSPRTSPGILFRQSRIRHMAERGVDIIAVSLNRAEPSQLTLRGRRVLELFPYVARVALPQVGDATQIRIALQPCIRDIWHDHVLFADEKVTGIVDFGAMRNESVAGDIARLLGSLERDNRTGWENGLRAYESVRSLSHEERQLVQAFDRGNVALSALQWLEWLYVDGRRFGNLEPILARLEEAIARMQFLHDSENPC